MLTPESVDVFVFKQFQKHVSITQQSRINTHLINVSLHFITHKNILGTYAKAEALFTIMRPYQSTSANSIKLVHYEALEGVNV